MGISQVGGSSLSTPSSLLLENATLQQTITSGSGTLTLSKPSWILIAGGGGGGGGSYGNASTNYGGGGGGSGGVLGFWAPSGTYTYSIGVGGSAGAGAGGNLLAGAGGNTYVFKELGTNQGYGWMACGGGAGRGGYIAAANGGDSVSVASSSLDNVFFQYNNGGAGGATYTGSGGSTATGPTFGINTQTSTTSFPIHLLTPHLASNLYSSQGSKGAAWFSQGGHAGQTALAENPTAYGAYEYNISAQGGTAGGWATYGGTAGTGGYHSYDGTIKASDLTRLAGATTAKASESSGAHRYAGGGAGGNGILGSAAAPTATAVGGNGGQGGGGGGGAGGVTAGTAYSGGSGGSGCLLVWNQEYK